MKCPQTIPGHQRLDSIDEVELHTLLRVVNRSRPENTVDGAGCDDLSLTETALVHERRKPRPGSEFHLAVGALHERRLRERRVGDSGVPSLL
jgi:hypothetical protein